MFDERDAHIRANQAKFDRNIQINRDSIAQQATVKRGDTQQIRLAEAKKRSQCVKVGNIKPTEVKSKVDFTLNQTRALHGKDDRVF